MPRSSRRLWLLSLLPLLLLVPLGVLKWHYDHPPLSKMDRELETSLEHAPQVSITGAGDVWVRLTGFEYYGYTALVVKDKAVLRQLAEALRSEPQERENAPFYTSHMEIGILPATGSRPVDAHSLEADGETFVYWEDGTGRYLEHFTKQALISGKFVRVRPRFVPRFEALITRLAQRAKAPGKHPEIVLVHRS